MDINHSCRSQPPTTIAALPPELLSLILEYVRDHLTFSYSPRHVFNLMHVSVLWRQVSLSTPELWFSLSLSMDGNEQHELNALQLLVFYIQNVKNVSFSLTLNFCRSHKLNVQLRDDFIHTLRQSQADQKIKSLTVSELPFTWATPLLTTCHRIESLDLCSTAAFYSGTMLTSPLTSLFQSPHFRRLNLNLEHVGVTWPETAQQQLQSLSTAHLTHISLNQQPIDFCLACLVLCPKLVEFRSRNPIYDIRSTIPPTSLFSNPSPIIYNDLTSLEWEHPGASPWHTQLIYPLLQFPSLLHLKLSSDDSNFQPGTGSGQDYKDFLRCVVESFQLSGVEELELGLVKNWTEEFCRFVFERMEGLRKLDLEGCEVESVLNVLEVLDQRRCDLSDVESGVGGGGRHINRTGLPLLPSLQLFRCRTIVSEILQDADTETREERKDIETTIAHRIANVLRNRDEDKKFCVEWMESSLSPVLAAQVLPLSTAKRILTGYGFVSVVVNESKGRYVKLIVIKGGVVVGSSNSGSGFQGFGLGLPLVKGKGLDTRVTDVPVLKLNGMVDSCMYIMQYCVLGS